MHSSSPLPPFVLHTLPISAPWVDHSSYTWSRVQVTKLLIIQFSPASPVTSLLFGPNTLLSTLFSNSLSLCDSLNVRDQVSHPYRTTDKIRVLYISIFMFFNNRQEDIKVLDWMVTSINQIQSPLNSFLIKFWFFTVVPQYLKCHISELYLLAIST
jgi:hypothetical protein